MKGELCSKSAKKGCEKVSELDTIFMLTREDVIGCAEQMGIPAEAINLALKS